MSRDGSGTNPGPASLASQLPQKLSPHTPAGASLPRDGSDTNPGPASLASQLPQKLSPHSPAGASLPRDGSDTNPGPHRWQASSHRSCPHITLQERACLAMAPTQTRAPASLASQLPQKLSPRNPAGASLPRDGSDTNPGPHRWQASSHRSCPHITLQERACLAMAPAQTRGPHRWQASSHRSCPHIPLQERACLAMAPIQIRGPHRWQASSHRSCPHIALQERACLAMAPIQIRARIAGKPAPTEAVPT